MGFFLHNVLRKIAPEKQIVPKWEFKKWLVFGFILQSTEDKCLLHLKNNCMVSLEKLKNYRKGYFIESKLSADIDFWEKMSPTSTS